MKWYALTSLTVYVIVSLLCTVFDGCDHHRTRSNRLHDLLVLMLLVGWLQTKQQQHQRYVAAAELIGAVGFGLVGELSFMRNDLNTWTSNPYSIAVYSTGAVVTVSALGWELYCSEAQKRFACELAAVTVFIAACYSVSGVQFHLHHYALGALLASFFRRQSRFSAFAHGIYKGIMVHGLSSFGVAPLFEEVL